MDPITLFLLLLIGAMFLWRKFSSQHQDKRLPPGPRGYPIVGSLFSIDHKHQFLTFMKWRELYGDIVMYKNGTELFLLLNSYNAVKEALVGQGDIFAGRTNNRYLRMLCRQSGIVLIDGFVWKEHRRFTLRVLRDFGLGRPISEDNITAEVEILKQWMNSHTGEPLQTKPMFMKCSCNIIGRMTFGERCVASEELDILNWLRIIASDFNLFALIPALLPFIIDIPPLLTFIENLTPYRKSTDQFHDFIQRKINEHIESLGDDIRHMELHQAKDLCDALIIEKQKQDKKNPMNNTFTECQLVRDLFEIFGAGTETTATTLAYAMFYMAINPEIQQKVFSEINDKIGQDRRPTMKDRTHLPYVNAVIDEVSRCGSIAHMSVPHRTVEDTELMGFFIPKDVTVIPNLFGIHHDPELWEKPNEFYPEHFLTADGLYKASEYLIPFSFGKRACLGESLARMELFLIFVSLMQSYNVRMADAHADLVAIERGFCGGIHASLPHDVIFSKRCD